MITRRVTIIIWMLAFITGILLMNTFALRDLVKSGQRSNCSQVIPLIPPTTITPKPQKYNLNTIPNSI